MTASHALEPTADPARPVVDPTRSATGPTGPAADPTASAASHAGGLDGPAPATFSELFAVSAFRVVFASRSLAVVADTLRIVALSVLVLQTTRSAWLSAVAFGIGFLPQAVGGLLFGSLADRIRPRRLIAVGYLLECVTAVGLALVPMPAWAMLVLVALVATGAPVFNGTSSRLVADVLHGDAYVLGRSMMSMSGGAAQLLGLAAGGLTVTAIGPHRALLATAGCHLVAAVIVRYGLPSLPAAARPADVSAVRQSWTTNTTLLADPRVRRLLLIQWLPCAFVVGAEALLVAYSAARGFSSATAGLLLASSPAGMLIGQFVVGRLLRPSVRTHAVAPLILVSGLPLLILVADPPAAVCAALVAVSGTGFAYSLGVHRAFLDAVPPPRRGQAFSLLTTGLMTLQGLGPVGSGAVAQAAGVRWAVALSALATMACVLLVVLPRAR